MLSVILVCLLQASTTLDKSIKNKVEILNNQSEYETSRELLRDFIDKDNKIDAMNFWISLDERLLNELNNNIRYTITSIMYNPKNETVYMAKYFILHAIPVVDLAVDAHDAYNWDTEYQKHSKSINNLKNEHINLISLNRAKDILEKYNKLKKSQQTLKQLLNKYIIESNDSEFKSLLPILTNYKSLKNKIKTQRTNFVSYTVVSPYLADAHRYIILSNDDIVGHNENYLQKAAEQMAKGAYKDILLESNEDVREQFYNVYRLLKDVAGDKELEDLKVLQTLMDSSSRTKQNGADKWWE